MWTIIKLLLNRMGTFGKILTKVIEALLAENASHPELLQYVLEQAKSINSLMVIDERQSSGGPMVARPATRKEKRAEALKRIEAKLPELKLSLSVWAKNALIEMAIPSVR